MMFSMEAGVESSMSLVGLGVDSSIRVLAWGCSWGSPGGSPPLQPPFLRAGGRALI